MLTTWLRNLNPVLAMRWFAHWCIAIIGSSPFGTLNCANPVESTYTVGQHIPPVLPQGGKLLSQEMTSQYSPSGRPVCSRSDSEKSSLLITINPISPRPNAIAYTHDPPRYSEWQLLPTQAVNTLEWRTVGNSGPPYGRPPPSYTHIHQHTIIDIASMRQEETIASSCNCVLVSAVISSLNTAPKCFILRSNNKIFCGGVRLLPKSFP